ncbi:keratin-associated protein 5-8-like [Anoplophora glabripennis]|uniref:keratin-associated protein 5-8-like n=1 Tax=Anoplophora glabripennis TaxID=217634 RepID=UPI0008758B35|nr:keratin-associated protein 5-8-like [Anoplophora glabripennis]
MPCQKCGFTKAAEQTPADETSNLTLSERREAGCTCAKGTLKSRCSSTSSCCSGSRSNRGCSCCYRSCCACCRCCSRSSGDFYQRKIDEATAEGCVGSASKKQETVKPAVCGCQH